MYAVQSGCFRESTNNNDGREHWAIEFETFDTSLARGVGATTTFAVGRSIDLAISSALCLGYWKRRRRLI